MDATASGAAAIAGRAFGLVSDQRLRRRTALFLSSPTLAGCAQPGEPLGEDGSRTVLAPVAGVKSAEVFSIQPDLTAPFNSPMTVEFVTGESPE